MSSDVRGRKDLRDGSTVFFTWDIQYQCNYRCTYCFLNFEKETQSVKAAYLRPEEWLKIWNGIHERYGRTHIHVTGGEPFAYPGFMDIVKGISAENSMAISTNFSFDVDEFMRHCNPDNVRIEASLHMEFVEVHDFLSKLKILRNNGYLTSLTVVAYPPMLKRIQDVRPVFEGEGFRLILFPYRGPHGGKVFPEGYDQEERQLLRSLGLDIGEKVSADLRESYSRPTNAPEVKEEEKQKICHMGQLYAKIMPSGEAFRCCGSVWDSSKPWENWGGLGNVINGTFRMLAAPERCRYFQNCKCYKSMVIGEEERWRRHWKSVADEREEIYKERELSSVKELRDSGQASSAKEKLSRLLDKYPGDIKSLTLLGELLLEEGSLAEAQKALNSAEVNNIDPDNRAWILRVSGRVYCRMGLSAQDAAEKEELLDRAKSYMDMADEAAVRSNNRSDLAEIYYDKAFLSSVWNSCDEAEKYIAAAIQLQPDNGFFRRFSEELAKRRVQKVSGE